MLDKEIQYATISRIRTHQPFLAVLGYTIPFIVDRIHDVLFIQNPKLAVQVVRHVHHLGQFFNGPIQQIGCIDEFDCSKDDVSYFLS